MQFPTTDAYSTKTLKFWFLLKTDLISTTNLTRCSGGKKGGGSKHVISAYEFTIPALDIIAWASVSLTVSGRPNKI